MGSFPVTVIGGYEQRCELFSLSFLKGTIPSPFLGLCPSPPLTLRFLQLLPSLLLILSQPCPTLFSWEHNFHSYSFCVKTSHSVPLSAPSVSFVPFPSFIISPASDIPFLFWKCGKGQHGSLLSWACSLMIYVFFTCRVLNKAHFILLWVLN